MSGPSANEWDALSLTKRRGGATHELHRPFLEFLDHRTAALTLYALQTTSANLRMTSFEPEPTHVMIDPEAAARRPLGASAWSKVEGRE